MCLLLTYSGASCGDSGNSSTESSGFEREPFTMEYNSDGKESEGSSSEETSAESTTEPETEHISPMETLSANSGTQVTIDQTIQREDGSNTVKIPLADLMEDGDKISSFTFIVYSGDGLDIGELKGGCGISVNSDCPDSTDEGWYQSDDFTAQTEGSYGEITWSVPENIRDYISVSGEVLFGYWWGESTSLRVSEVICSYTRTREIPVDNTVTQDVGTSVNYSDSDNIIGVSADFLAGDAVPEAVTFNISSGGAIGKFTGAFGYRSSEGNYQSSDTAVFTDGTTLSLTWFVPQKAKSCLADDGEFTLGYWWSEQESITLDSITVKYSTGNAPEKSEDIEEDEENQGNKEDEEGDSSDTGYVDFMDSENILRNIKVGWNLGNSLESYNTTKTGLDTETGWGNPETTQEIIDTVKKAGFNAVRIPVTWGEHMSDDNIIETEWLDRVQEVIDYAYNSGMYVIMNMHHDDYIWFNPTQEEYEGDSEKFCAIWKQLAERFKDYDYHLLFEGMNEPRTIDSPNEWIGGTPQEREIVNKYDQDFVDTVRGTGGNNSERTLIVTTYGASAEEAALNDVIIPRGRNIVLNVHYYAPWEFADGTKTTFGDADKTEIDSKFSLLKEKFIDKGTPVIIDEFGCVAEADDAVRADYYGHYITYAKMSGIKCFVWDNNVKSGESSFGLLDRKTLEWNSTIIDSIMNAVK